MHVEPRPSRRPSLVWTMMRHDVRGVVRDDVLVLTLAVSVAMVAALALAGVFRAADPSWQRWAVPMVALALLTGPTSWGFVFGLLMVDEKDSGVRAALVVTPVPPERMVAVRLLTVLLLQTAWPLLSLTVVDAAWHTVRFDPLRWLPFVSSVALAAPATALAVATYASNKVEALALYKGISFVTIASLALYALPADAWYRSLFLLLPSGWVVHALDALTIGRPALGWIAGVAAFHTALVALLVRAHGRALRAGNA